MLRRALNLLLISAILPGILLPGQTAVCLCAALSCVECHGCCAPVQKTSQPARSCCAAHQCASQSIEHDAVFASHKNCQGCFVLAPDKQATANPEVRGKNRPEIAPVVHEVLVVVEPVPSVSCEASLRPTSHAPPGTLRSLPLLI
jgi:hypothetical protein